VTELLFDLYPEAILIRNGDRQLPFDILRKRDDELSINNETGRPYLEEARKRNRELLAFLSAQMGYGYKAQDENALMTPDHTCSLPLHYAVRTRAPLGSIKLLVKGYPNAIRMPDRTGMHPLDIAIQVSPLGVVKYLAELTRRRLNRCDRNKNYPLHHACREGKCEVIEYLLDRPMSSASVSERNIDDKLPIHLFCEHVWCCHGYDPPKYTEIIWRLLSAYPETVLNW
jgi:ankyrin repeat protein